MTFVLEVSMATALAAIAISWAEERNRRDAVAPAEQRSHQ